MENIQQIYPLREAKRLFRYPYRLSLLGWMPHHIYAHINKTISGCFVCLTGNSEGASETWVDGELRKSGPAAPPRLGIILPGTRMHTMESSFHDEIFFHYEGEAVEEILKFFGPETIRKHAIELQGIPEDIIAEIRRELRIWREPGAADRLDQLAIRLFTRILCMEYHSGERKNYSLKIQSIADGLQTGGNLSTLLRKYAMSERTFYREWRRVYNVSPRRLRLDRALERACGLLCETEMTASGIALECGFRTPVYFHQCFHSKYGLSPRQYREEHRVRLFPDESGGAF